MNQEEKVVAILRAHGISSDTAIARALMDLVADERKMACRRLCQAVIDEREACACFCETAAEIIRSRPLP
jgi:hypothetical protein